jgi:hypothetical protein
MCNLVSKAMATRRTSGTSRAKIIESITTPLAYFTLGLLVIEGILASLSLRASGSNLTILIVGMLIGFALLCSMVFVLTIHPKLRHPLLGSAEQSPFGVIRDMQLTKNDIRVLFRATMHQVSLVSPEDAVLDGKMPIEMRLKKLIGLELIRPPEKGHPDIYYRLTNEGFEFGRMIYMIFDAVTELKAHGKLG